MFEEFLVAFDLTSGRGSCEYSAGLEHIIRLGNVRLEEFKMHPEILT